jgi:predicted transposase YdaD
MPISALQCFICGVVFRTKKVLSHHLEVALRHMYHDHLILQEEPIQPDVPVPHRAELAALHHFRKITEEVAAEQHVVGGTSLFLTEVTELDAAGQH